MTPRWPLTSGYHWWLTIQWSFCQFHKNPSKHVYTHRVNLTKSGSVFRKSDPNRLPLTANIWTPPMNHHPMIVISKFHRNPSKHVCMGPIWPMVSSDFIKMTPNPWTPQWKHYRGTLWPKSVGREGFLHKMTQNDPWPQNIWPPLMTHNPMIILSQFRKNPSKHVHIWSIWPMLVVFQTRAKGYVIPCLQK